MKEPQQQPARKDPKPRRIRRQDEGSVTDQRPDRHYVLAYAADVSFGLSRHLTDGYVKVNAKSDKERVVCGRVEENGDVTWKGHVLVWIDRETWEANEAYAAEVVKARNGKAKGPGGIDNVVGVNGKPASDFSETN